MPFEGTAVVIHICKLIIRNNTEKSERGRNKTKIYDFIAKENGFIKSNRKLILFRQIKALWLQPYLFFHPNFLLLFLLLYITWILLLVSINGLRPCWSTAFKSLVELIHHIFKVRYLVSRTFSQNSLVTEI